MKSAYLYVRVSTDEQKRKGYSLPEQEDRLLKYCKYNNIEVKGIYREDYSAKNFNRPAWKELFSEIKKKSYGEDKNILFIKWDRFSRNVEYAYEMIGMLRKYKTVAMAIEQPIDFSVPESTVMLAVYLAVPEAENLRRAQNTANGIRRAKLMGRYPSKAPLGFINLTLIDGKKVIAQKEPEASIIKWAFNQLNKNIYTIQDIRKEANEKGLICSRSQFYKIIRNPLYCGLISIKFNSNEEQIVKGTHEPLVSESLFYEVQSIINTKRKITGKADDLKATFFLRGFLICSICGGKLTGSFSKGSAKKYPYYHCQRGCKLRVNALFLNKCYQNKLQEWVLSNNAVELFEYILKEHNILTQKKGYLSERTLIEKKIKEEEVVLSRARKLLIANVLKTDDYYELKKENKNSFRMLKKEVRCINAKLNDIDKHNKKLTNKSFQNIFQGFSEFDFSDKRHLLNFIRPVNIDFTTGDLSLEFNNGLSKILSKKRNRKINKDAY